MKKLLILGAGTAGTMVANRMARLLDPDEWRITLVDQNETHYYQPGFLFIPFGIYVCLRKRSPRMLPYYVVWSAAGNIGMVAGVAQLIFQKLRMQSQQ